jgi:hypothetical protein
MSDRIPQLIDIFLQENGAPMPARAAPPEAIAKYEGVLPNSLLALWRRHGWTGYGQGHWWLVNPADFDDVLGMWLEDTPFPKVDRFHCFARSAFGALHAWGETLGNHLTIDCAFGHIVALPSKMGVKEEDAELALATKLAFLSPESADIEDENGASIFAAAVQKFRPLDADQMFGFEPALVLGAEPSIDTVRKLRMDVHLRILREFGAPRCPGF